MQNVSKLTIFSVVLVNPDDLVDPQAVSNGNKLQQRVSKNEQVTIHIPLKDRNGGLAGESVLTRIQLSYSVCSPLQVTSTGL